MKVRRDLVTQTMTLGMRHESWRAGAKVGDDVSEIRMRRFWRYEIEHLLARAGFAIEALYGGCAKEPYDARREVIVVVRAV